VVLMLVAAGLVWLPFKLGMVDRYLDRLRYEKIAECRSRLSDTIQKLNISDWKNSKTVIQNIHKEHPAHWGAHTCGILEQWVRKKIPEQYNVRIEVSLLSRPKIKDSITGVLHMEFRVKMEEEHQVVPDVLDAMRLERHVPRLTSSGGVARDAKRERYNLTSFPKTKISFGSPVISSPSSSHGILIKLWVSFEIQPLPVTTQPAPAIPKNAKAENETPDP